MCLALCNQEGYTALMKAARMCVDGWTGLRRSCVEIVELLVKAGVDVNMINNVSAMVLLQTILFYFFIFFNPLLCFCMFVSLFVS